mgnify:CR=1 FL=1
MAPPYREAVCPSTRLTNSQDQECRKQHRVRTITYVCMLTTGFLPALLLSLFSVLLFAILLNRASRFMLVQES